MAMSVTYTNFGGRIVTENRGGTVSHYTGDTLGSTVALVSTSGTITDTWTYWPYGEVQARTGTNSTPFTFCGALGYFQDLLNKIAYVRARMLRLALTVWQTVDPLWPLVAPYGYCGGSPVLVADPLGLNPGIGVLVGLVGGEALLVAILAVLGVALAVALLYLLIHGLAALLAWLCGKAKGAQDDACTDMPGGCDCTDDCASAAAKEAQYAACADARYGVCVFCFSGECDPPHIREIAKNAAVAARCALYVQILC